MQRYATGTDVPVDRSKAQIESLLIRYGADEFVTGWNKQQRAAAISFTFDRIRYKIRIPMPDAEDEEFTNTDKGRKRNRNAAYKAWGQGVRARWRAALLVIRAKLEAVETGIASMEQEFLAYVALPGGKTVWDKLGPDLPKLAASGKVPPLLTG